MATGFKTVTYVVAYKTDRDTPQHIMTFSNQAAAVAFAFTVEVNGGVSIVTRKEQETPFSGRNHIDNDFDS